EKIPVTQDSDLGLGMTVSPIPRAALISLAENLLSRRSAISRSSCIDRLKARSRPALFAEPPPANGSPVSVWKLKLCRCLRVLKLWVLMPDWKLSQLSALERK